MSKPYIEGKVELKEIFHKLKAYKRGELSREKVVEELRSTSPIALLKAEQILLEKGFSKKDLSDLSEIYADIFSDRSRIAINHLDDEHPIRILLVEHALIKGLLKEFSHFRDVLANPKSELDKHKFRLLMKNLAETEKHFLKEEHVLLPKLREIGLSFRVDILAEEHDTFIKHVIRLDDLARDLDRNRTKILEVLDHLVPHIHMHAFTEGTLLYPVALKVIDDWEILKNNLEIIGDPEFIPVGSFKPMKKKSDDKLTETLEYLEKEESVSSGFILRGKEDER